MLKTLINLFNNVENTFTVTTKKGNVTKTFKVYKSGKVTCNNSVISSLKQDFYTYLTMYTNNANYVVK